MKTLLAGILLLVVAINADEPCQVPKRSSGNYNVFGYSIEESKVTLASGGKMYYDANNRRIRVEGVHDGQEYTVIIFYDEGKQYILSGGHCFIQPTEAKFQNMSIPANATLATGGRIGTPLDGLYINRYFGQMHGAQGIVTVTQSECVITNSVSLYSKDGVNIIYYFSFTDVSLSYDDNVFTKPEDCSAIPPTIAGVRARRETGNFWNNLDQVLHVF